MWTLWTVQANELKYIEEPMDATLLQVKASVLAPQLDQGVQIRGGAPKT